MAVKFFVRDKALQRGVVNQSELAREAGIDRVLLGNLWNNRVQNANVKTLAAIARVLDCDIGDLVTQVAPEPQKAKPKKKGK